MLSLLLVGLLGLKKLPVSDMPNVDYPSLYVTANLPGASPETVARDLTSSLEREFSSIQGLKHLSSSSWLGGCYVFLQFPLEQNIDAAMQEVQRAIDRANLPRDLPERPRVHRRSLAHSTVLYAVFSSSTMSPQKLYQFASNQIQKPLSFIEGVAEVRLSSSEESLEIEINPELLAARGLTISDVRRSLEKAGASFPIGSLEGDFRRLGLFVPQSIQTKSDLEELSLGSAGGFQLKLKDVASIEEKGLDIDHFRFIDKMGPKTGILIEVKKQPGANVVDLCRKVREELSTLQKQLPPTQQIQVILDQSIWIEEAVFDLKGNLALALILVAAVIFVFLGRLSDTLIPSLALPLSLLGTAALMHVFGYSLDILSLLALTLAMGFVVDDAIVVLENIARLREEGKTPLDAALIGSKEIGFTILSITLSLVAVFIPLIFMDGILGKLFREFSVTLSLAILLSGVISLTLTPMLAAKLKISHKVERTPLHRQKWLRFYEPSLLWCLSHPKTTISMAVFSFLASIFVFKNLNIELLPKEDLGWGFLSIQLPNGIQDKETESMQELVEKIISENPFIDCLADWSDPNSLSIFVKLVSLSEKRAPTREVLLSLQEKLEEIPGLSVWNYTRGLISLSLGDSDGKEGYSYTLRSYDLKELQMATECLEKALRQSPLFEKISSSLASPSPQLSLEIAKEKAAHFGFSAESIQYSLQSAYTKSTPILIDTSSQRIPVRLKLSDPYRKNSNSLSKLSLRSPTGFMVPLKTIASWKEDLSSPSIQHLFQLPTATLSFTLAPNTSLKEATSYLDSLAKEYLSASTRGDLSGDANAQKTLLSDMLFLFLFSILAMYVILGILYESFIHPLTILSSLPFAGLGAALSLLLFQEPLSLYSFVGLILLIGIVKKNGIMLVDHALESSKPPKEAIFEACLIRLRPILMTTLAALMGAVPVALGLGAGGHTRRGLGIAIAGGLLFSQMLTLYLTPVVFLYFEALKKRWSSR